MTDRRTTSPPAPLPVLRAAVFAGVGTVLGLSAHHLAAPGPVPWRHAVVAAGLFLTVGLAGARRPRRPATVVATCGAAQAGLHLWLTASARPSAHAQHAMAGHEPPPAMTALHAVAAVLVAVLLHRADVACWSLSRGLTSAAEAVRARLATAWTLLGGRPALTVRWVRGPVRRAEEPPLKGTLLAYVVVRRGPPGARHVN
ncbi:hypothetical protein [Streptomyces sp. NPDC002845]